MFTAKLRLNKKVFSRVVFQQRQKTVGSWKEKTELIQEWLYASQTSIKSILLAVRQRNKKDIPPIRSSNNIKVGSKLLQSMLEKIRQHRKKIQLAWCNCRNTDGQGIKRRKKLLPAVGDGSKSERKLLVLVWLLLPPKITESHLCNVSICNWVVPLRMPCERLFYLKPKPKSFALKYQSILFP